MAIKERKQITGTTEQIQAYAGHEGQIVWDRDKKTFVGMSGTAGKNYPLASQTYVDTKFLPLAGGELLGAVSLAPKTEEKSSLYLVSDGETDEIQITVGGETLEKATQGTSLTLRKIHHGISNSESSFSITAKSSKSASDLLGSSTGSLKWGGKEVERVNAIGANYIRYESGLQIVWGNGITDPNGSHTVTYPVAFINYPSVSAIVIGSSNQNKLQVHAQPGYYDVKTSCVFWVFVDGHLAPSAGIIWTAIGRWK